MSKQKIRHMKIQEEPIDEVKIALVSFFEREGGYSEVAKVIGGNAQQLHYIVSGRNDPTLKTVMRILRFYPSEVELRRVLSLPIITSQARPPVQESTKEDTEWKARFDALEIKHDDLQKRYYKLINAILREKMGLELD